MARAFCIPGIVLIFLAFALSVLVTISLPTVHTFDIVRVRAEGSGSVQSGVQSIRWGIWGYCTEAAGKSSFSCHHTGLTYGLNLGDNQTVGGSYTRGLVVHVISLVATFIALLLAFSEHLVITLVASLVSFLAALITLIALAIDIALYVRVHKQANDVNGVKSNTDFGPAFWMTLAQLILLILAGFTVCFGRRRDRMARGGDSYPMLEKRRPWYRRFGRRA